MCLGMNNDVYDNLRLELRRERWGSVAIEEGAPYPMLRRLLGAGGQLSPWREEDSRRKRFYRITQAGGEIPIRLLEE